MNILNESKQVRVISTRLLQKSGTPEKEASAIIEKMMEIDASKNHKNVLQFIQLYIKYILSDEKKDFDVLEKFRTFSLSDSANKDLSKMSKDNFLDATKRTDIRKEKTYLEFEKKLRDEDKKYAIILTGIYDRSSTKSIDNLVDYFRMWKNLRIDNKKSIEQFQDFEALETYVDNNSTAVKKKTEGNGKYFDEAIYRDDKVVIWFADNPEKAIKYAKEAQPNTWCISRDLYSGSNLYYNYRIGQGATFYLVKVLPNDKPLRVPAAGSGDYSDFFIHMYDEDRLKFTGKPNGDSSMKTKEQLGEYFPFLNKPEIMKLLKPMPLSDEEQKISKIQNKSYSDLKNDEERFLYANMGKSVPEDAIIKDVKAGNNMVVNAIIGLGAQVLSKKVLDILDDGQVKNYHRVQDNINAAIEADIIATYAHLIQ